MMIEVDKYTQSIIPNWTPPNRGQEVLRMGHQHPLPFLQITRCPVVGHPGRARTPCVRRLGTRPLWAFHSDGRLCWKGWRREWKCWWNTHSTCARHCARTQVIIQRRKWFTVLWEGRGWGIVPGGCDVWTWGMLQRRGVRAKGRALEHMQVGVRGPGPGATAAAQGRWRRVTDGMHSKQGQIIRSTEGPAGGSGRSPKSTGQAPRVGKQGATWSEPSQFPGSWLKMENHCENNPAERWQGRKDGGSRGVGEEGTGGSVWSQVELPRFHIFPRSSLWFILVHDKSMFDYVAHASFF